MQLNIGMIGMGVISKYYVDALTNRLSNPVLTAVCDLNESRLQPFREKGISSYLDYQELLKRDDIHAVVINVPNDKHFEICKQALLAGKHVCCEKPMTLKLDEARQLVELSRAAKLTMFTAFHRRYNVHFEKALERLTSLEDVSFVTASYLEKIEEHAGDDQWYLQPERCGGGCVADNGPNVYDTLAFFLGHMKVQSVDITRDERNIDMEARVELVTEEGIPVTVDLDWAYPNGEQKDVRIVFKDGGEIYIDMLDGFQQFKSSLFHEYEAILVDFVAKIEEGNCHGEDGYDAVRLVHETYEAEAIRV
ncbi:Gfo/Idh/MocA family protein [Paenibacillus assamensis]|uniref:Gfo/Idh/MocA family protein n=1 Tax=Paenibacillus assamensis TaxID=311244 RepID=UPI0004037281|nr:Gfo/Idh/MocA family oxidoreductase [Paenibacillus assamensis]